MNREEKGKRRHGFWNAAPFAVSIVVMLAMLAVYLIVEKPEVHYYLPWPSGFGSEWNQAQFRQS